MELTAEVFVFIAVAAFLGAFIQRVSGFGYGIVVMLFFPLVLSMGESTALSGLGSLTASCVIAYNMRKHIRIKKILPPLIPYCVIGWFAMAFVKRADSKLLLILLGTALCGMSIYFSFFSGKIHIRPTAKNALLSGSIGGVLSGMFSMGGPPMVLYFLGCTESNDEYIAQIQMFFVISNITATLGRAANGFVTGNVIWLLIPTTIAMFAANYLGGKVYDRISGEGLRRVVYAVVGLCGVLTILRATVLAA